MDWGLSEILDLDLNGTGCLGRELDDVPGRGRYVGCDRQGRQGTTRSKAISKKKGVRVAMDYGP